MKNANTTKTTRDRVKASKTDWSRFDAMTEAQRHAAAINDPDAQPGAGGLDGSLHVARSPSAIHPASA